MEELSNLLETSVIFWWWCICKRLIWSSLGAYKSLLYFWFSGLAMGRGVIQVTTAAPKTMEDAVTSAYQILRARLAGVPWGTAWSTVTRAWKLSSALRHHDVVRMVRSAFPRSKFATVMLTVRMDLMKWPVSTSYPAPVVHQCSWLWGISNSMPSLKYLSSLPLPC